MSQKSGQEAAKSLKGQKKLTSQNIDMKALMNALQISGLSLQSPVLENATIYGNSLDATLIGSIQPSDAWFTNVYVGRPTGMGGNFRVYGYNGDVTTYNPDGTVASTTKGDSMIWDPAKGQFDISGAFTVRDCSTLGNLKICKNTISAINTDGDIHLVPQSTAGSIFLAGNIVQESTGIFDIPLATSVTLQSFSTSVIDSRDDNTLSTQRGNINIYTASKNQNTITAIVWTETNTKTVIFPGSATSSVTIVVTYEQTLTRYQNIITATTFENGILTHINVTTKTQGVSTDTSPFGPPGTPISTIVVLDTTVTPSTASIPESRETLTYNSTVLLADSDYTPIDQPDQTTDLVTFTTATPHGLDAGQTVTISGTDSIPSFDGTVTIHQVPTLTTFTLLTTGKFTDGTTGQVTVPKTGSMYLGAFQDYSFEVGVPIYFGKSTEHAIRPAIQTTDTSFTLDTQYLKTTDPIPTLQSPNNIASDSGILTSSNGFFGVSNATGNFTWIPQATVTRNPNGSKTVAGSLGTMSLYEMQLQRITGEPNITLNAPLGTVIFNTRDPINLGNSSLQVGNAGSIGAQNGSLVFNTPNSIFLSAGQTVTMPTGIPLVLSPTTSIVGNATANGGGLQITSQNAPVTFQGDIYVPSQYGIYLGKQAFLGKISGDSLGNVTIGSTSTLKLAPTSQIVIPDNVLLQIGDHNTSTGLIASNGTLTAKAGANLILQSVGSTSIAAGTTATLTSGGDTTVTSGGNLNFTSGSAVTNLTTTQLNLPTQSEINWGTGSLISTIGNNRFLIQSNSDVNVSSPGTVTTTAADIALTATDRVLIPTGIPLQFGTGQQNGQIYFSPSDGLLHVSNANGVLVDQNVTIGGNLTVNGGATEIVSTKTVIEDPIIALAANSVPADIKDRGIQFSYGQGQLGFMGFSQVDGDMFYLLKNGVNTNEIFTKDQLGDLKINALYANQLVSNNNLVTSLITGNPALTLAATDININATSSIKVPDGIPIIFGPPSTNATTGPDIKSAGSTLIVNAPLISLPQGQFSLKGVLLSGNSSGSFSISNAQVIDTSTANFLYSPHTIALDGVANTMGMTTLPSSTLALYSPGSINLNTPVVNIPTSIAVGGSLETWDAASGKLVFSNGSNPSNPLYVSIKGIVQDAYWRGQVVETLYGGTGRADDWHKGSIVFVDSPAMLTESPNVFYYDATNRRLSIGATNSPDHTISLGAGNVDLQDNFGQVLFRTSMAYSWSIGKLQQQQDTSMFAIAASITGSLDPTTLTPYLIINKYGQFGIGQTSAFMNALSGAEEERLYLEGSMYFTQVTNAIRWGQNVEIRGANDGTLGFLARILQMESPVMVQQYASFLEDSSRVYGSAGGILNAKSTNLLNLDSPHVLVTQNRMCIHHSNGPSPSVCDQFIRSETTAATLANELDLAVENDVGNIFLRPLHAIKIPDLIRLDLGIAGSLEGVGSQLQINPTGNLLLNPAAGTISIPVNTVLSFGNGAMTITQMPTASNFTSVTPVNFTVPSLNLPDGVPITFGTSSNRIQSTGDNLQIFSPDLISLESNNVLITGNLIVTKMSTVTIESESNFDSGIITLGGAQKMVLQSMGLWRNNSTIVETGTTHNLRVGDTITLYDTIPNIDGTYQISEVPSATSFAVPIAYPGLPTGAHFQGSIRSSYTSNPGFDDGVAFNWHTGATNDTTSARVGFFGFDRATQRFQFIPNATKNVGGNFIGQLGDAEFSTIYANTGLSTPYLLSSLNTGTNVITGSNFIITGGNIDNTPIGNTVPSQGTFTYLHVTQGLVIDYPGVVTNLNADMLDGHDSTDFVFRDGSLPLTANWNAGIYRISSAGFTDTTLQPTGVVFAGTGGKLTTDAAYFNYTNGTLTVPQISSFKLVGNVDLGRMTLTNGYINNMEMTGNIFLDPNNTLDVSQGTIIFRDDQISGDKIKGGLAETDISGNAATVTNGLYRRDFNHDNSIMKADTAENPVDMVVPEDTLVGRLINGQIAPLTVPQVVHMLDAVIGSQFLTNSILKADAADNPVPLQIPEDTLVGRSVGGVIDALTPAAARTILDVEVMTEELLYRYGALLRSGHTHFADGAKMLGNLYTSSERLSMTTGQTFTISTDVETTYVTVNFSRAGGKFAYCNLGPGYADGHRKVIVISSMADKALFIVNLKYVAPNSPGVAAFGFMFSGQSALIQWDNVANQWFIVGTGCATLTNLELQQQWWRPQLAGAQQ